MTATAPLSTSTAPWQIDPTHTEVEFSVRHLMISNVKGRFGETKGSVRYDSALPNSLNLDVTIGVGSIDTRNEQRDTHLKSADFFDAATWPTMRFVGKRVDGDISDNFKLVGDLTIKDVTKEVTLDVTAEGKGGDPWGNDRLGFSATGQINRADFNLKYNQALETGGVVVGETVKIIINAELMRPRS